MSPGPQDGSVHVERYGSSVVTNNRPSPSHKYGIESKGNKVIFKGSHSNTHYQYYNGGYAKPPDVPRPQQGGQQSNWVGVPLISMANNNRRHRKPFGNVNGHIPVYGTQSNFDEDTRCIELNNGQQIPLSKLALHTQGAPLIIQGRYPNNNQRRFINNNNNPKIFQQSFNNRSFKGVELNNKNMDNCYSRSKNGYTQITNQCNSRNAPNSTNIDSVSVTSDESSGSGNSEACLPRIIKPRKRRKKDRKPNVNGMAESGQTRKYEAVNETVNMNNIQRQHYNPMCYDVNNVRNELCVDNNYMPHNLSSPTPSHRNEERFPFCDNSDLLPEFMLNVSSDDSFRSSKFLCERFERSECTKSSLISAVTSVCQCRYCDPSGHIWETDDPTFSEIFEENSSTDFAPTTLADSMKAVGSTKGGKAQPERDPTLRRSWSDPSSTHSVANLRISEETDYSNLQPVNSENQLYSLFSVSPMSERKPDSIFGSSNRSNANSPPQVVPDLKLDSDSLNSRLELNLEVSSEIVTSLNGHRDLEIKFFSNSPPAVSLHNNSFFSHAFVESRNVEFEKDDALNDSGTVKDINDKNCEKPVCDKDNVTTHEGKFIV